MDKGQNYPEVKGHVQGQRSSCQKHAILAQNIAKIQVFSL